MHNDCILVPLTHGKFAVIDASDAERVFRFRWRANHCRGCWYAAAYIGGKETGMHRYILGSDCPASVDHIDGDGLNNRRANLRPATHAENMRNRKMQRNNTSGYRGVSWHSGSKKWRAKIKVDRQVRHLGVFAKAEDAARAYDAAATIWHGEFKRLNFPHDD